MVVFTSLTVNTRFDIELVHQVHCVNEARSFATLDVRPGHADAR